MPVYLIRAGEHGPVKIGYAEDVSNRIVKMQSDNHERLTVLRIFVGSETEERRLHTQFADLHLHGEWFAYSRRMLCDVGLEEIEVVPKQRDREVKAQQATAAIMQGAVDPKFSQRLRAARRAANLTQIDLANLITSSHSDISHYENGSYSPSLKKLAALATALSVTVGWLIGEPEPAQ